MQPSGARFKATQAANIRYNVSCLKKNLVLRAFSLCTWRRCEVVRCVVGTVGMVGLDEILFETLSKNGTNTETITTSLLSSIVYTNQDTILLSNSII